MRPGQNTNIDSSAVHKCADGKTCCVSSHRHPSDHALEQRLVGICPTVRTVESCQFYGIPVARMRGPFKELPPGAVLNARKLHP